jgi:hypothetical protein
LAESQTLKTLLYRLTIITDIKSDAL